jgi:hypothetical protein
MAKSLILFRGTKKLKRSLSVIERGEGSAVITAPSTFGDNLATAYL